MAGPARLRRGLAALLLGLLAATGPLHAETRLSPDEGRQFAIQLVQNGQPTAARAAALALLARDPDDVIALIVLSRAERDLGNYAAARAAAARAHALAPPGRDRFGAALAMAQALASEGRRTAAQLWLRRAAEDAPDARTRAIAVRDFAYVRSRNPFRARISFGARPSSNVNDGPTTNTILIGGFEFVNPDAVPLSGLGFSAAADLSWRLVTGERSALTFGVNGAATHYALSDAARAAVPTAQGSDFASESLSVSAGWSWTDETRSYEVSLAHGRDWEGGAAIADWNQLGFRHGRALGEDRRLVLGLTLQDTTRRDAAVRSSQMALAEVGHSWGLTGGDRIGATLEFGRVWSDAASVAHRRAGLTVDWQKAKPLWKLSLSAEASLGLKLYDQPLYIAEPRRDLTATLGVTAVLSELDYMGFAPEIGLTLTKTDSNIPAMTTEKAELRFGIRSVF